MTIIEQIKAEIDKRYVEYREKMKTDDFTYYEGMADALDLFEQFLDTLESEKPIDIDFEQELYKHFGQIKDFTLGMRIGQYFYELGCRRTAEKYDEIEYNRQRTEESVPKDLEEAAEEYAKDAYPDKHNLIWMFKRGAKCQREQMMKEAIEGVITNAGGEFGYDVAAFRFDDNHTYSVLLPHEEKRKYGDKVRIIIVKEDEK